VSALIGGTTGLVLALGGGLLAASSSAFAAAIGEGMLAISTATSAKGLGMMLGAFAGGAIGAVINCTMRNFQLEALLKAMDGDWGVPEYMF
jgi:hypothetical protein